MASTFKDLVRTITSFNLASSGNGSLDAVDAMVIQPTANAAAADVVTITNASFAEASTITIPDPGVAAAMFDLSPAGAGNYTSVVTLTPAQVITASTLGIVLIPAPSSTQSIIVLNAMVNTLSTGHTAYAAGGVPTIQYGSTTAGGGVSATAALTAAEITASANAVTQVAGTALAGQTGIAGLGIYFGVKTQNFTGGTGTNVVITLNYMILNTGAN